MKRDQIIATLKAAETALRKLRHAALFGSAARGEERPDSDIDILVEFEPSQEGSIYDYVRLKEYVAGLFEGPVDVIDRDALKPDLRAPPRAIPCMPSEKESGALREILRTLQDHLMPLRIAIEHEANK